MGTPIPGVHIQVKYAILDMFPGFRTNHSSTCNFGCLQVVIGMDVAASEFYSEKEKTYDLNFKDDVSPGFGICFYEFAHVNI